MAVSYLTMGFWPRIQRMLAYPEGASLFHELDERERELGELVQFVAVSYLTMGFLPRTQRVLAYYTNYSNISLCNWWLCPI